MKQLFLVLACLAAGAGSCFAAAFGPVEVQPGGIRLLERFHLWVAEGEEWQAVLEGDSLLRHRLDDGEWLPAGRLSPPETRLQQVLSWELAVEPAWLGPGSYSLHGSMHLQGGEGIVWQWEDRLCVLPMNSHHFTVSRSGETFTLIPGRWYVFTEPVEIRWQDELVPIALESPSSQALSAQPISQGGAAWLPHSTALQAGQSTALVLRLTGPAPAGVVTIRLPRELVLQDKWQVGTAGTRQWFDGAWHVEIPALDRGSRVDIRGVVTALLPATETTVVVEAVWHGSVLELPVRLGRGWFARRSAWRESFPSLWLLGENDLSAGSVGASGFAGGLTFGSEGASAFVRSAGLRLRAEREGIRGELMRGPWRATANGSELALTWNTGQARYENGHWLWVSQAEGWRGTYADDRLRIRLDLSQGEVPQGEMSWNDDVLRGFFSSRGVKVSVGSCRLRVGADWATSSVWAEFPEENLRLVISSHAWSVEHSSNRSRFRLLWGQDGRLRLDAESEHAAVFLQDDGGRTQWGLALSGSGWSAALHVVDSHAVAEVAVRRSCRLTEQVAAFVQAGVQLHSQGLDRRWAAGLHFTPASWLSAQIAYDTQRGLGWQVGLTISR